MRPEGPHSNLTLFFFFGFVVLVFVVVVVGLVIVVGVTTDPPHQQKINLFFRAFCAFLEEVWKKKVKQGQRKEKENKQQFQKCVLLFLLFFCFLFHSASLIFFQFFSPSLLSFFK